MLFYNFSELPLFLHELLTKSNGKLFVLIKFSNYMNLNYKNDLHCLLTTTRNLTYPRTFPENSSFTSYTQRKCETHSDAKAQKNTLYLCSGGVEQMMIGMAHRCRLNLLTTMLHFPPTQMFRKGSMQLGNNRFGKQRLDKFHKLQLGKIHLGKSRLDKYKKCAVGQM